MWWKLVLGILDEEQTPYGPCISLKHRGTLAVEDSILFIKTWCGTMLPNQCDHAGSVFLEEDI